MAAGGGEALTWLRWLVACAATAP